MTLPLSWYLIGFAAAAVTFTGNWWWLLLWLAALVLDFLADAFRKSKLGQALERRRQK